MNNILKIKDLPENERPQERLLRYGVECLSNAELISIILRTGFKGESILNLSNRLLCDLNGLNGLLSSSLEDIEHIRGIGVTKACQIMALSEIAKRSKSFKSGDQYKISNPLDVANLIMEEMRYLNKEYLKVVLLNTKNVVIAFENISIGSLNSSIVHPREVFTVAVKKHASSIIICHNHPSGDPTPSSEDINVTKRLKECGRILGIDVIDHIIIGNGAYISLKEKGII